LGGKQMNVEVRHSSADSKAINGGKMQVLLRGRTYFCVRLGQKGTNDLFTISPFKPL